MASFTSLCEPDLYLNRLKVEVKGRKKGVVGFMERNWELMLVILFRYMLCTS